VRLRSGFKPWEVDSVRRWTAGLAPEPTVYGWVDEPEQAPPTDESDSPSDTSITEEGA